MCDAPLSLYSVVLVKRESLANTGSKQTRKNSSVRLTVFAAVMLRCV